MGVSTNFYTMYGIKTDWLDDFSEAYEDVYEKNEDLPFILMGAMCGDYMVFGSILFDSGDARYGFEDGDSFKEIDLTTLKDREERYKKEFIAKFPQFAHLMDAPFKLISIAHYS